MAQPPTLGRPPEASAAYEGSSNAGRDDIIVVQPVDASSAPDEIVTGARRLRLADIRNTIRRLPAAAVVSIVAVAALVVAATLLNHRIDPSSTAGIASSSPRVTASPRTLAPTSPAAPGPTISRLPPNIVPPVDVVVANELRTSGGDRFDLSWAGLFPSAMAVAGGWLVQGIGSVWYLDRSGRARPLLWHIDYAVVGRNGLVAWKREDRVGVARLDHGVLVGWHEVDAKGYDVHWIIGDIIVMGMRTSDGLPSGPYGLWRPWLSVFEPDPHELAATPFGPNHAGTGLLGIEPAPNGQGCLVEINPDTFAVIRRACVLTSSGFGPYTISPDGRWLLLNVSFGSPRTQSVRIDLSTVFGTQTPAQPFAGLVDISLGGVRWLDSSTFVAGSAGGLRRVDLDNPTTIIDMPLAGLSVEFDPSPARVTPVKTPE